MTREVGEWKEELLVQVVKIEIVGNGFFMENGGIAVEFLPDGFDALG